MDVVVGRLYGLAEEEIAVVEGRDCGRWEKRRGWVIIEL